MKKVKKICIYEVVYYKESILNPVRFCDVEYIIEDNLLKIKDDKMLICYPLNNLRSFEIENY